MALPRAFVIRCWQEENLLPDQPPAWRFLLSPIGMGHTEHGFAEYGELVNFLKRELELPEAALSCGTAATEPE